MRLVNACRHLLVFAVLLVSGFKTSAQDSTLKFALDTSLFTTASFLRYQPGFSYPYRSPNEKDRQRYRACKYLIAQQPTLKNHKLYFNLACSLWELEKIADAEQMFLSIINSKSKYYTTTYYHSSDIPGDKTKNIYGYGSFTTNYKNYSAIYLCKIYLERKQFEKALQYLEDAVSKYKVTYNCGTGFHSQQNEYNFLYASCYERLNRHKEVIDLLMPSCLDRSDELIITAIKNTYSQKEIKENLMKAEASIECLLDSFPSYAYQTTYSSHQKEKTDTIACYSGMATIILFDRKIDMPVPHLDNGERLTKDKFLQLFRDSDVCTRLKEQQ